ncbi:MAG: DUF899 family protein [Phycisphaerales bacterium]|nr:DUF899 family protein [Phycisphaerales bacterium]MCB9836540.1 DUF899 family protein [Phycisphaera sp.]
MPTAAVVDAYTKVIEAKKALLEAIKAEGPERIDDWELRNPDSSPVRLSELFGAHDELLVVHNMGSGCSYCTLWADGFRGIADHVERRCALVLCSDDEPARLDSFAKSRGWNFRCVSGQGSDFAKAMGYRNEAGKPLPGVSALHRSADGTIVRTGHTPFGPGDDFCAVWPFFDLLEGGVKEWVPR